MLEILEVKKTLWLNLCILCSLLQQVWLWYKIYMHDILDDTFTQRKVFCVTSLSIQLRIMEGNY